MSGEATYVNWYLLLVGAAGYGPERDTLTYVRSGP